MYCGPPFLTQQIVPASWTACRTQLPSPQKSPWPYHSPLSCSAYYCTSSYLCAIVIRVVSGNFSFKVFCMKSSVFMSTFAVASSRTMIRFLFRMVRARQINCFWPTENTELTSLMSEFRPSFKPFTCDFKSVSSSTCQSCSSLYSSNGSRLRLIVPVKRKGYYGIMPMLDRSFVSPSFRMSWLEISSVETWSLSISAIR